ncbi:MAG: hypothetical protein IKG01_14750 [Lachnospiraceae bacterium]|nr:hypothetical protein [Lachnospiraceae bacterium]
METNWREIIDLCAKGQDAMTKLKDIRIIVERYNIDNEAKLIAIKALVQEEQNA